MFTFLGLDLSTGIPITAPRGPSPVPRRSAAGDTTLELTHEPVDDVPRRLGSLITLRPPEILDRPRPPRPLHQGPSHGGLITARIASIRSRAAPPQSPVPAWAERPRHTREPLIGRGPERERSQSAVVGRDEPTWTERVPVIRSESTARGQAAARERRLTKTEAAARGLTPPPGPGRTPFTTGWEWERAVNAPRAEADANGLLTARGERPETSRTHSVGPGRGGPQRRRTTEQVVRHQITAVTRDEAAIERLGARMGGQARVTNAPASRRSRGGSVLDYRAGTCCGARVPPVAGPAAGDPPAVRPSG